MHILPSISECVYLTIKFYIWSYCWFIHISICAQFWFQGLPRMRYFLMRLIVLMKITTARAYNGGTDLHATCVVLFPLCVWNRRGRTMYCCLKKKIVVRNIKSKAKVWKFLWQIELFGSNIFGTLTIILLLGRYHTRTDAQLFVAIATVQSIL